MPRPYHLLLLLTLAASLSAAPPSDLLRTWQGIPGLEVTPKGRVFVSWYSGGPKEPSLENTVYLTHSDDRGQSFAPPTPMAGPRTGARAFDPTLWRDPRGRLWYIFNRGNKTKAEHGVYARLCAKPDAPSPVWTDEFRLGFNEAPLSFRMNKPTVLASGEWILPVTHAADPTYDWFAGPRQREGIGISRDKGKTWTLHGAVQAPEWALESMIVELRDKRLWMLIRTGSGVLWQSHSSDRGRTWTPATASTIANPGSRFFIRRLRSGNLLLVNHHKFTGRSHLTAQLSTDDGQTWNDGLLLDERPGVSYPDGVEDSAGLIRIVYDRDRGGAGEILLASFRENDVAQGRNASGQVRLKQLVNRLEKPLRAGRQTLLPPDWDAKAAGDRVLSNLVRVTAPEVKGAHDSDFVILDDRAYIVAEMNDQQAGENPAWPYIYVSLAVLNLKTNTVEKNIPFARGGQAFDNQTLPPGACFVPRIIRQGPNTLRAYFTSEAPGQRQSQMYYRDFDTTRMQFAPTIHPVKIKTSTGVFAMQPQPLYEDARAHGFTREPKDYGLYMIDAFKRIDGQLYTVLNNFAAGQNALALVHPDLHTFEVLGHFNEPGQRKLTESAVQRLPDGSWLAICRQEEDSKNYTFTTSPDGKRWTPNESRPVVPNGANSKPTLDRFFGLYYLGWQEATRVNGVSRSVFNVDISVDGVHWERKYRFATDKSFQYPSFREHRGGIYFTVTQGDTSDSRKERILFGRLD
ncbi:MAG: sialidase family protein [Acidobacteriota bacterium]